MKYGERVCYQIDGTRKGVAKVVGVATIGVAILGRTYILEDLTGNFPSANYPYPYFACFESWMTKAQMPEVLIVQSYEGISDKIKQEIHMADFVFEQDGDKLRLAKNRYGKIENSRNLDF